MGDWRMMNKFVLHPYYRHCKHFQVLYLFLTFIFFCLMCKMRNQHKKSCKKVPHRNFKVIHLNPTLTFHACCGSLLLKP